MTSVKIVFILYFFLIDFLQKPGIRQSNGMLSPSGKNSHISSSRCNNLTSFVKTLISRVNSG